MEYNNLGYDTEKARLKAGDGIVGLTFVAEKLDVDITDQVNKAEAILDEIEALLQQEIKAQEKMLFESAIKVTKDQMATAGTSQVGFLKTSYKKLKEAFGPPAVADTKSHMQWILKIGEGTVLTIYDYSAESITMNTLKRKKEYKWHIGATSAHDPGVSRLIEWVKEKVGANVVLNTL